MNSIARLREAMPILRAHVQRGDYDAVEVELAQLTSFQRHLLGVQLCLQIGRSYLRKWFFAAQYGVRTSWVLSQWALFWLWLRVRRLNFRFPIARLNHIRNEIKKKVHQQTGPNGGKAETDGDRSFWPTREKLLYGRQERTRR